MLRSFFLTPTPVVEIASDNNSKSLVISINFGVGTILFTGDATGNTVNSIYGDTMTKDININAVSLKNRNLLRRVNFLIGPHHGSETDGSYSFLFKIIKLSYNSFVGVIFCAPDTSQYKHPNSYIDLVQWPLSAKSWEHKIGYYREDKKRIKILYYPIFITCYSKFGTYWLNFSLDGMFMFSEKSNKLVKFVYESGWSKHTNRLLNLQSSEFLPIVLNNPQELSVYNANGETPFLHLLRLNNELSNNNISLIKNMLLVSLLISDDENIIYFVNYLKNKYNLKSFCDKFIIETMPFQQSLEFLFKRKELTNDDINLLKSFNDPFINIVLEYLRLYNYF